MSISPLRMSRRRPIDQRLRAVAAHRGVVEAPRGDAETLGEEPWRVAVPPGELRRPRARRRLPADRRVRRRLAAASTAAFHQRRRFECVVQRVAAMDVLADTDDHRRARIDPTVATMIAADGEAAASLTPRTIGIRRLDAPNPTNPHAFASEFRGPSRPKSDTNGGGWPAPVCVGLLRTVPSEVRRKRGGGGRRWRGAG